MADDTRDLNELVECYIEQEKMYSNEGERGLSNLDNLAKALGYEDRDHFLRDNSGAVDVLFEWVRDGSDPDWEEKLRKIVPMPPEETPEELERQMDEMMQRAITILRPPR